MVGKKHDGRRVPLVGATETRFGRSGRAPHRCGTAQLDPASDAAEHRSIIKMQLNNKQIFLFMYVIMIHVRLKDWNIKQKTYF